MERAGRVWGWTAPVERPQQREGRKTIADGPCRWHDCNMKKQRRQERPDRDGRTGGRGCRCSQEENVKGWHPRWRIGRGALFLRADQTELPRQQELGDTAGGAVVTAAGGAADFSVRLQVQSGYHWGAAA